MSHKEQIIQLKTELHSAGERMDSELEGLRNNKEGLYM